jgi:hypothetical protein
VSARRVVAATRRTASILGGSLPLLMTLVIAGAAPTSAAASTLTAPTINVSGQTLQWTPTTGVSQYVFVRKVPGQTDQYSVVTGTSTTPPAVPGATVHYSVRTNVAGSAWAKEVAITYPATSTAPSTKAAPQISVSGGTVTWNAVTGVSSYVLATIVPGKATTYSVLTTTSVTPAAVPGVSARYAVRTNVEGSAWSSEVSIAYPAVATTTTTAKTTASTTASTTTTTIRTTTIAATTSTTTAATTSATTATTTTSSSVRPSGSETEAPFGLPFVKGIVTNIEGWGLSNLPQIDSEMNTLGVNWARENLSWASIEPERGVFHWSAFDSLISAAKADGVTILPLALTLAPSWASPGDSADYAAFVKAAVLRYGPGTSANLSWWELGNEPYFAQSWGGSSAEPEAYARDFAAASEAAKGINASAKMLVAADYQDNAQVGGLTQWEMSWVDSMFAAVPSLGHLVDGVAVHLYGGDPALPLAAPGGFRDTSGQWAFARVDTIREKFLAHGVNVPFWITEAGWSTWEMSEATQAKYYTDLAPAIAARPWIRALFPFCLREFQSPATNNQTGFGLLKFGSWEPKLAFTALEKGLTTLH